MILTILLSIMMMAGLFLMLWGGVGFLQDKRFFSSAPKEELAVIPDKLPERFKGQHAVGWMMIVSSLLLMGGAIVILLIAVSVVSLLSGRIRNLESGAELEANRNEHSETL